MFGDDLGRSIENWWKIVAKSSVNSIWLVLPGGSSLTSSNSSPQLHVRAINGKNDFLFAKDDGVSDGTHEGFSLSRSSGELPKN